jgi:signal transduction histidine kinase
VNLVAVLRRYRLELLWLTLIVANYVAMIIWPSWDTIPFCAVWIGLTLIYGFQVGSMRATLFLLAFLVAMTAATTALDVLQDIELVAYRLEVPLIAAMFLTMLWYARGRADAAQLAEEQAEQRRSLLERQEHFISDASHELRTPVTIARGHLELLRGPGGRSFDLMVALDELDRIDAIIERLLVLAAADQPEFLTTATTELEPLLEDVFLRWSEAAPRSWRLGALVGGHLLVDPGRLRVALDALIENAVKYSRPDSTVELRARLGRPGEVVIEVEDEAGGVSGGAESRIFERFARADSARTRDGGGVGLGLAIVDAIVKAHGGKCTVTNTGQGSIFALCLPNFAPAVSELPAAC